ncbi:MAG: SsrA-binding protein SmpB [Flavobacteriaceae bacterium]|mgnify:FL=1|nr:SsrA-binding protein SmpB [Flavobacteriaceae bacterium]
MQKKINIQNKKAQFEYLLLSKYNAGIVLSGTEIKSIRDGKASIKEAFCQFNEKNELFVVGMYIGEYSFAKNYTHAPRSNRKLLLNKRELIKLSKEVKNSGLTIIPVKLFINEKGFAKIQIALAKGKKIHDKREAIKNRDIKRKLDQIKKK